MAEVDTSFEELLERHEWHTKTTSCFYFRLRHPAAGPVIRQPVAVERRAYLLARV